MIEGFLQKKLAEVLDQFIEFEKNKLISMQGLTLTKSKIKPKLVDYISQLLGFPLQLSEGFINSITLNTPWQKLFLMKQSSIKLSIEGIKLITKLKNKFNYNYVSSSREGIIQWMTDKLTGHGSENYTSSLVKKIKQYFFDTLELEIKDIYLEIQVDLSHKVQIILKCDKIIFRKEEKTNIMRLNAHSIGISYKTPATKQENLLIPTNISFIREKSSKNGQIVSQRTLNIQKANLNINNYNFNDIRRVFSLISWHNSFMNLPCSLWRQKPQTLLKVKPLQRLRYYAKLIHQNIQDKKLKKCMNQRRKYISLYTQALKGTKDIKNKLTLKQLEDSMCIWKIIAYRSFCMNMLKKNKGQQKRQTQPKLFKSLPNDLIPSKDKSVQQISQKQNQGIKKSQNKLNGFSWMKSWFKSQSNQQQLIEQLQTKLSSIQQTSMDTFVLNIDQILLRLNIISYSNTQNFLLLKAADFTYTYKYDEIQDQGMKEVVCGKFKILYDEYLGHHKRYVSLIQTQRQAQLKQNQPDSQCQQFEDVINFFELTTYPKFKVSIQPIQVCINHQIIQKFTVFQFQKLERDTYQIQNNILREYDPDMIVKESVFDKSNWKNSQQINMKNSQQKDTTKYIITGLKVLLPQQMAKQLYPCTQVVVNIEKMFCQLDQKYKRFNIQEIGVTCIFPRQNIQSYEIMLNHGEVPFETQKLIQPFSVTYQLQQKQTMKYVNFIIKDKILIDISSSKQLVKVIDLLYCFKPKQKQIRSIHKMRLRRKQSIGQQFIDACQNLNEHIVKSNISAISQKQINIQNNLIQYKQTKLSILANDISILLHYGQISLTNLQMEKYSYSLQRFNIISQNEKNIQIKIHSIKQMLSYFQEIQQKLKKYNLNKEEHHNQSQNNQLQNEQVSQIQIQNLNVKMLIFNKKQNLIDLNIPNIDLRISNISKTVTFDMEIIYFYKNQKYQSISIPLIQKFSVQYKEKISYNHIAKTLLLSSITVDINPTAIKLLSNIYQIYQQPIEESCQIKNKAANQIRISVNNRYMEQKFNQSCTVNQKTANVIIYGSKLELNLMQPYEEFKITQNICLLRTQQSMKRHILESNLRIVNHQDKTMWVKIIQKKQQDQYSIKRRSTIEVKYLSQAKSFQLLSNQYGPNNRVFSRNQSLNSIVDNLKQSMNLPLKAKEEVHILVSSQDKCISILDQGISYTTVSIKRLLQQKQVVIQSQGEEYLILKCVETQQNQDNSHCPIYLIKILSPIYIVNNLPWRINYRLGKEALDIEQMINTQGRVIRKRSFQAIALQKIQPLQNNKLRQILYNQVHDLEVSLQQFSGLFKMSSLISNMMKNGKIQEQKLSQSSLICLSNGKRNLQLILKLQLTAHTLKIKFYPQYVFVNMSNCDIYFKIKQNQYTYPQTKLRTIKDQKKQNNRMVREVQQERQAFIKMYISLSNEKMNQRDILQQMFLDFKDRIQIFAGSINKKVPRFMLYESGLVSHVNLNSSSSGYNSGYGSGSDGKQYQPRCTSTPLCYQGLIQYGHQKSYLFHRNIQIDEFFNLVLFVPTIHIINKSKSFFVAKSKVQNKLTKIHGLQMDYIVVNKEGLSIQSVQQNEQVNLNEWFNIDISRLGTIYYAKQLGSNGYQSKQYVLRKKKLKKRPKIFYRIVLSQHDRGLQVLIEQSQYPPISFINKTHFQLKVKEDQEGYEEQIGPDSMAEFACIRRPYIDPIFRLFVAHNYEYQPVQSFGVNEFKTIPCALDQRFIISVEQFKDKTIVIFGDQKLMQMSQVKADFQIQKIESFHIHFEQILLSFMNNYYKQISCLKIQGIDYKIQNKNQKKYVDLHISDFQGYDYSGIQPKHTLERIKYKSDMFSKKFQSQKLGQNELSKRFLQMKLVISFHKNAIIVQKCHIRLAPSNIIFNSYLLLETIKVYHNQILNLVKCLTLNRAEQNKNSLKKRQSQESLMSKQFIFQSFIWEGTQLSLKCCNLHIICVFFDKSYYKWILQFIQWLGDFKPINFGSAYINYENFTLTKLINLIDIKRKVKQLGQILIDYPLQQLNEIINTLMGFSDKSKKQKFFTLLKLGKSVQYIMSAFLNINQNYKTINHHSYIERFKQSYEEQKDILKKLQAFQFAQWKYFEQYPKNKINLSISRLQRYNLKRKTLTYNQNYSRIKLALDSKQNNKIFRQITHIYQVNEKVLLGMTQEQVVFYFLLKHQWIVVKHEEMISIQLQERTVKRQKQSILCLYFALSSSYQNIGNHASIHHIPQTKKSKMIHHQIRKCELSIPSLKKIKQYINANRLVSEY